MVVAQWLLPPKQFRALLIALSEILELESTISEQSLWSERPMGCSPGDESRGKSAGNQYPQGWEGMPLAGFAPVLLGSDLRLGAGIRMGQS